MTVKGRLLGLKRGVSVKSFLKEHTELKRFLGYIAQFGLGFAVSCARVFDSCGPFGIGLVAQSGAGMGGILCLLGASAGYLAAGGLDWGIRYVATCVLVYTASFVFQGLKMYRAQWFVPLITAIITTVTGFLNAYELYGSAPAVVIMLTEVLMASGSAYFFRLALSQEECPSETSELRRGVGQIALIACVFMAFSGLVIMDVISVGRFFAVLLVMTSAFRGGLLSGAAAGAAMGLAMDISSGGTPIFAMAYTFAGLVSGMFSKHSRLVFVVIYILSNAAATLWTWGGALRLEVLYECFAGSVVFMLLPKALLVYVGGMLQHTATGEGEAALRRYSARRVQRMGTAFRDLYDTVRRSLEESVNDNDVARIFDRAADAVCTGCKSRQLCWQQNYIDTLSVMNDVTPVMMSKGRLVRGDMPERFVEKCPSVNAFVTAVNGELRALMYRRQFRSRLAENRTAAYCQYMDVAAIMEGVAGELQNAVGSDPHVERRLLRYLRGLDIDAEAAVFRDSRSRLRAVIESGRLPALMRDGEYLDKLSTVMGVRLCKPSAEEAIAEGRLMVMEAEPLAVSVGIAAMKKKGELVSGDRGTYFKTEQGVLCVILSDGMGSGEEAARESVAAVRILESFLRAGVEPGTAMKVLNSVMLLKNGEEWGFATIDLMCIDLFTGETCFYKYGAAPSYIRSGKSVRKVKGQSLAAGLCAGDGSAPDMVKLRLKPGAVAIIVSDGVLVQEEDGWLRSLLSGWQGGETRELARETLQGAVKQYGCCDDMTVLAVYVDKRA